MMSGKSPIVLISLAFLSLAVSACGSDKTYQAAPPGGTRDRDAPPAESIFSPGGAGAAIVSGSKKEGEGLAVNAYLWRASLDTIAFMPLQSADPFGGIIITDWYSPPETADERFKVNVYILGRVLRADGLKVSVFHQTRDAGGQWHDAAVGPEVATEFENAVLTRARELRLRQTDEK